MERMTDNIEYDNIQRKNIILKLCEEYPFIRTRVIGKSCLGRDICALTIGNGDQYSLFAAAFHGSEHITQNILLYFLEEVCFALKNNISVAGLNARRALFGRGVIFIPCVNPDGVEINIHGSTACGGFLREISKMCKNNYKIWNSNARGVDINHNFNADWENLHKKEQEMGIYGPSPTRFGGYSPESEPETIALVNLCKTSRIHHVTAMHSQGEVIYYTYNNKEPKKALKMAQIMATSSGYAIDVPTGIADGGGFKDWFINEYSRPGFTVEFGKGENPLPISTAFKIYNETREMLMLNAIM